MDLIIVALLTGAAAIVVGVAGPPDAVRIALMLPLVFFTPGYALVSALYSGRDDLSALERLSLSFALSLAILPLIALALNYSPWGVRWEPLMAFVSLLVVVASALGLLHRRYGRPPGDRFAPSLRLSFLRPVTVRGALRGTAYVAVIAPLSVVAVVLLVIVAGQRAGDAPYTEFFLLGSDGRPDSLPGTLMVGENASLIIGITNREAEAERYGITASIGGSPVQEISGLRLAPGQSWQRPFVLTPERPGNRQRVQFDLHMEGAGGGVYRTLRIWVDVLEPLAPPPVEVLAQDPMPGPTPAPTPTPTPMPTPAPTPASTPTPARTPTPTPPPTPTPTPAPPQPLLHTVVWGDNLTFIALFYGVPLGAVIDANPLPNPDLIHPWQEILIPVAGADGESE